MGLGIWHGQIESQLLTESAGQFVKPLWVLFSPLRKMRTKLPGSQGQKWYGNHLAYPCLAHSRHSYILGFFFFSHCSRKDVLTELEVKGRDSIRSPFGHLSAWSQTWRNATGKHPIFRFYASARGSRVLPCLVMALSMRSHETFKWRRF